MSLDKILNGVFDSSSSIGPTMTDLIILLVVSLIIGLIIALSYSYKTRYTKSFVLTLATLPAVVCMVIMMVNGNIGAGVAVAGTFSLVRFRSVPGTAKEIGAIFLAMSAGLCTGMGYLLYALVFTLLMSLVWILYSSSSFGEFKSREKLLKITIPEDLDYTGIFDDLFFVYLEDYKLVSTKTASMGSLYKLTYEVILKNELEEKSFIDDLRCRNGNLEISLSRKLTSDGEL